MSTTITDKFLALAKAKEEFNAAYNADPFQRAMNSGACWADINEAYEAYEAKQKAEQKAKICPWAPKKAKRDRE
jgi:hypothetical protein